MNKKAFTLIELLAVIVILSIIAIIAIVIISNIVNDTKKSASTISTQNYLKAVEQAILNKRMVDIGFNPEQCTIQSDGNLICDDTVSVRVETDGERPIDGGIRLEDGTIVKATVSTKDTTVVMDSSGELSVFGEEKLCSLAYDTKEPELYIGAKYDCKVDPEKPTYGFYVLSKNYVKNEDGTSSDVVESINLIMDQNINSDGSYPANNLTSSNAVDGVYGLSPWGTQNEGPTASMLFMLQATEKWTNVPPLNFSYDKIVIVDGIVTITRANSTTYNFGSPGRPLRARMPLTAELDTKVLKPFLYDNLSETGSISYYTQTPSGMYAFFVSYDGTVKKDGYMTMVAAMGMRPVITIPVDMFVS